MATRPHRVEGKTSWASGTEMELCHEKWRRPMRGKKEGQSGSAGLFPEKRPTTGLENRKAFI
jgi:hypothetical protein